MRTDPPSDDVQPASCSCEAVTHGPATSAVDRVDDLVPNHLAVSNLLQPGSKTSSDRASAVGYQAQTLVDLVGVMVYVWYVHRLVPNTASMRRKGLRLRAS